MPYNKTPEINLFNNLLNPAALSSTSVGGYDFPFNSSLASTEKKSNLAANPFNSSSTDIKSNLAANPFNSSSTDIKSNLSSKNDPDNKKSKDKDQKNSKDDKDEDSASSKSNTKDKKSKLTNKSETFQNSGLLNVKMPGINDLLGDNLLVGNPTAKPKIF